MTGRLRLRQLQSWIMMRWRPPEEPALPPTAPRLLKLYLQRLSEQRGSSGARMLAIAGPYGCHMQAHLHLQVQVQV